MTRPKRETAAVRKAREEREAAAAAKAEHEAEEQRAAEEKAKAEKAATLAAAAKKKAEEDRAIAEKQAAAAAAITAQKNAEAARFNKAEEERLNQLLAETEKELEDEEAELARIDDKERLERALRILQRNTDPAYVAAKEALRHDLGEKTFKHLAEECFGIPTYTFDYKIARPASNPELTIWAYMNALKKCSHKGLEHVLFGIDELPEEPNTLFLRKKKGKNSEAEYVLNFSQQNADAMLRHLYGALLPQSIPCNKCQAGNGALAHCYITNKDEGCANCLWNHSGPVCSYIKSTPKKRKAEADAISVSSSSDSDSEEDIMEIFEALDRKQCLALAKFFRRVTDQKKKKAKAKKQKGRK